MGASAMKNPKKLLKPIDLSRREAELLAAMAVFSEETLVYERGKAYFGLTPISRRTVFSLIRGMCISLQSGFESVGSQVEHYTINSTGRDALARYWGLWADK